MKMKFFTKALRFAGVGLVFLCAAGAAQAPADAPATASDATSGAQQPIVIPLPHIDRKFRNKARSLTDSPTLVRRLPARLFRADMKTYEYLLDNLPITSRLADILDYGYYRVVEMEDGRFHGEDYAGVKGDFWAIYADPGKRIYLGEGSYNAWYTPKISAKVLIAVEYQEVGAPGRQAISTRVDIYVSTNKLVGRIMELMGRVTDRKLSDLVSSAQDTSQDLASRPRRVWEMMNSSGLFTPEELESVRLNLLTH